MRDPEWGPAFIKTIAYAPWPVWIYLNAHECAKRQATKRGIAFQALDNGFRSVADDVAVAGICNSLSERQIERFWHHWEALGPLAVHGRGSPARLPLRAVGPAPTVDSRHGCAGEMSL